MTIIAEAKQLSKWYGQVLGCSNIDWKCEGGIIGLLGPNGAGKSTFMKMLAGLIAPSRGTLEVCGGSPFHSAEVRRQIGYAPEHENTFDQLTALELVTVLGQLAGIASHRAGAAAREALVATGLEAAMNRQVKGFSKGMKQRTKLAGAMVHAPKFLLLDEPLTGVDPMARIDILNQVRALAAAGATVVVSTHVLTEIEALTNRILVLYQGQVLAEGDIGAIRQLIDKRPHRIRLECREPRTVAALFASAPHVVRLQFEAGAVLVETRDPNACYDLFGQAIAEHGLDVSSLTSLDNNLAAVFEYLTAGRTSSAEN
ncbi:MAG: ABC transporter ATP-binding protein [Myxococcales bacterium]|nr:ABC transporter ATP-binding protein [Myxococcales bacterium]